MDLLGIIRYFISFFNYFCMAFTLLLSIIYIFQLIISFIKVRKNNKKKQSNDFGRYISSENLLPISLLIPAYNEEENVVSNIKSLMKMDFPNFEIVVVNDGSTDEFTLSVNILLILSLSIILKFYHIIPLQRYLSLSSMPIDFIASSAEENPSPTMAYSGLGNCVTLTNFQPSPCLQAA